MIPIIVYDGLRELGLKGLCWRPNWLSKWLLSAVVITIMSMCAPVSPTYHVKHIFLGSSSGYIAF